MFQHTKVEVWGKLVGKSLHVLFKEYPSLQKDQLWLTWKKGERDEKNIERKKKRDSEKKEKMEAKKKIIMKRRK